MANDVTYSPAYEPARQNGGSGSQSNCDITPDQNSGTVGSPAYQPSGSMSEGGFGRTMEDVDAVMPSPGVINNPKL